MGFDEKYVAMVKLLFRCLVPVSEQKKFALKGGTAINFFNCNMPRISVDIDLTYVPVIPRQEALQDIRNGLYALKLQFIDLLPGVEILEKHIQGGLGKLTVMIPGAYIKIEPNLVWRGTVFPVRDMELCSSAQDFFEQSVNVPVLSEPDLYGSKLCAALDRQHPRDLFDVKVLQDSGGITPEIRRAFVIYLAGHNRPMSELLAPNRINIADTFEMQFAGMTTAPVTVEELKQVQDSLASTLVDQLDAEEKKFLLSLKAGEPDWACLGIDGLDRLPALQWKLRNIQQMESGKRKTAFAKLETILA